MASAVSSYDASRPCDYAFKVVIVGDSGVGKSCLLLRFTEDSFSSTYIGTIGIDFKIRTLEIDGKLIKVSFWDTAGQERFRHIVSSYYRGAQGVIIVYDTTNQESFKCVPRWLQDVDRHAGDVRRILVGNKCDLVDERRVSKTEAEEFAKENGLTYLETSAKTATNVEQAFITMVNDILAKFVTGKGVVDPKSDVTLGEGEPVKERMCYC